MYLKHGSKLSLYILKLFCYVEQISDAKHSPNLRPDQSPRLYIKLQYRLKFVELGFRSKINNCVIEFYNLSDYIK